MTAATPSEQPVVSSAGVLAFDPRRVPALAPSSEPHVPPERLQAAALRARFAAPPAWVPEVREEPRLSERAWADAAVLIGLVQRPAGPTVLLTERTQQLSTHSGQVAFPGGRVDPGDDGVVGAALREAEEEVALPRRFVEVLGTLPVYATGTRFRVTPVVALVRPGFALVPNPAEVAHVFEVPLEFLMDPAHHRRHRAEWDGTTREWYSMPYLERVGVAPAPGESLPHAPQALPEGGAVERYIWGATAGMLRNLYRFLAA